MKTIVYQSYRTANVPTWIERCLSSVRDWARTQGHDYHFAGDEFLELAPAWYRQKAGMEICPVADLSRLIMADKLLSQGYDLVIWVDADILIFNPEGLRPQLRQGFAFTHELWTYVSDKGRPAVLQRVNNSVMLFAKQNVHLGFFVDACLQLAHTRKAVGKLDVGTDFLTKLRNILPFALLENVGMLSPPLMQDIAHGTSGFLQTYAQALRAAPVCANLCASLQDQSVDGFSTEAAIYDAVVEKLLSDKGECITRWQQR